MTRRDCDCNPSPPQSTRPPNAAGEEARLPAVPGERLTAVRIVEKCSVGAIGIAPTPTERIDRELAALYAARDVLTAKLRGLAERWHNAERLFRKEASLSTDGHCFNAAADKLHRCAAELLALLEGET